MTFFRAIPKLAVLVALAFLAAGGPAAATDSRPAVHVLLATDRGDIEVVLYPDKAPLTAGNFLRYVDKGYFDGGGFYRVVRPDNDHGNPPISVIQGGPRPGTANKFPPIAHESTATSGLRHRDGTISMARGAIGTAGAEFFITIGDQPGLDAGGKRNADGQGFAAFGQVVRGMDVVRAINALKAASNGADPYTKGQVLIPPVIIKTARRVKTP